MSARVQRRVVVLSGFNDERASRLDVALAVYDCLRVRIDEVPEVVTFCCGGVRCDAILVATPALAQAVLVQAATQSSPCPPVFQDLNEPPEALARRLSQVWILG